MSEKTLYKYLSRIMSKHWEVQRHEDKYSSGIPDLSYCIKTHGWIELKYLEKLPKKIMKIDHLTSTQRNWIKTFGRRGGLCFVLLQVEKNYMIFGWEMVYEIGQLTYDEHKKIALKFWENSINPDELKEILIKGF